MNEFHSQRYTSDVITDIISDPVLKKEVQPFLKRFIKFAALQRMNFEPDIKEELQAYYKRKRMYQYNVRKWYRIIKYVFKRDDYTCQYCGQIGGKLEADHIIPFSRGGSDHETNLTTACLTCNRQKKDRSVAEFLKWREDAKA